MEPDQCRWGELQYALDQVRTITNPSRMPDQIPGVQMTDLNIIGKRLQSLVQADPDVVYDAMRVTVWGDGSSCSSYSSLRSIVQVITSLKTANFRRCPC